MLNKHIRQIFVIFLGRVGDGDGDGDDRQITDDGEDSGDSEAKTAWWQCGSASVLNLYGSISISYDIHPWMCLDSWLVCMYGGNQVLVWCVGIASTHQPQPYIIALTVRDRSGFLFRLDYIRYIEVVLNIQGVYDETSLASSLVSLDSTGTSHRRYPLS